MSKWQDGYDTGYKDGKTGLPKYVPKHVPRATAKLQKELEEAEKRLLLSKELLAVLRTRRIELREKDRERYRGCQQGYTDLRQVLNLRHLRAVETIVRLTQKIEIERTTK